MNWDRAEKFVYEYLASDNCQNPDDVEVGELTRRVAAHYSDNVTFLAPTEIAKFAKDFQEEKTVNTTRVVPPRRTTLSGDELDAKIRAAMQESDSHWYLEDAIAYIAPIRQRILDSRGTTVRYDAESLTPFIDAAQLPIKSTIENALKNGWVASNYQRFQGGDGFVLDTFRREGHLDETSAQTFCSIINVLGKEQNWALNTHGHEQRAENAIQKAKAAILSLGKKDGRPVWPQWDPRHGKVMWRDAALLDAMSVDELLVTIEQVSSLHKQMHGSRDDQRERLGKFADANLAAFSDAAGDLRKYRAGDRTELDGQVQFKEGSGARFEFVGEHSAAKPSANPKMEREVVQQSTTVPYSKEELYKIARDQSFESRELWRKLLRQYGAAAINQALGVKKA